MGLAARVLLASVAARRQERWQKHVAPWGWQHNVPFGEERSGGGTASLNGRGSALGSDQRPGGARQRPALPWTDMRTHATSRATAGRWLHSRKYHLR